MSDSLRPHGLQHTRLSCPSLSPWACSNSRPLSWWCHPTISSSVVPFPSCLQSFPASGSFPMSRVFASGCQSIGTSASASVLLINIQGWFPLGLTGLISLQSNGLSRVFSNTTVQKHQFFGIQPSLWSSSHIYEIKRRLLLGRKAMTNIDSILKSRDITLPTKVHLVKAMVFPVVMYGYAKGQFSFQSQRRAMPKYVQTTTQLHAFHTLARSCSKSFKLGFNCLWPENFQMYKLDLEKAEETEIKLPTSVGSKKSWSSDTLAILYAELTQWKWPWCWERLRARGWDGWMESLTQWTWIWANSERQFMGQQRVGHDLATEQQKYETIFNIL